MTVQKYASEYPLPGGVGQYFDTLIVLLRHVSEKPLRHDALVEWIIDTFSGVFGDNYPFP